VGASWVCLAHCARAALRHGGVHWDVWVGRDHVHHVARHPHLWPRLEVQAVVAVQQFALQGHLLIVPDGGSA